MHDTIDTPVLIVGGGPTGLTASRLLSNLRIPHVLVERRNEPQKAPAAHVINRRTMEIFRQAGMDMDAIYALDRHGDHPLAIRWKASLNSPTLATLVLDSTTDSNSPSRESTANISQSLLETQLLVEARRSSVGELQFGHEWVGFVDGDKARNLIRSPDGTTYVVKSAYTLAADGAGSPIRQALGVTKTGPQNVATFLSLSCAVDRSIVDDTAHELLTWCLDPKFSGVVITHDPASLSVVMRQIHEPHESLNDYSEATCQALLTDLFGKDTPFTLLNRSAWQMTAQVADRFRNENVFLVGDAAHRFPPTGGLGLNSGVADVHNLIWKIRAHLKGAPDDLLDTYEAERMPVVQRNCDASLKNFLRMDEVIAAIGLDSEKASLPARILAAPIIRHLPQSLRTRLIDLLTAPARAVLKEAGEQTDTGERKRRTIQQAADRQMPHFDMPELELGYTYPSGVAIAAGAGQRYPHTCAGTHVQTSILERFSYDGYTLLTGAAPDTSLSFETFGLSIEQLADPALGLNAGDWVLVRPDGHIADQSARR
ncbi:FAD-dependent monooxygenase [Pyruvatibacter sp.]|uniref:FAD-dependent monooxygenase n=1 Tax=Pyruvatibacter sp. TaxID=1981328 RepID=UPI0032640373